MTKHYIIPMGLLLELDELLSIEKFNQLAKKKFFSAYCFYLNHKEQFAPLRNQFNQGETDEESFIIAIRKMLGQSEEIASDKRIREAWNAMIKIPDKFQADWNQLNRQGNIHLLSDSNSIHKKYLEENGLSEITKNCAYSFEKKRRETELYKKLYKEIMSDIDDGDEVFVVMGTPNGYEKTRLMEENQTIKEAYKEQNSNVQFIEVETTGIENVCAKLEGLQIRPRI
ncbi:MAG: hypothetical protein KKA99_04270 [Gammaproteobacteria bacterium]|nr:hypothetical protein [Gammaproteobacteria bacterium]MBU2546302.1 hypothetical protein [Gammaproteobacteria bacterium]